MNKSTCKRSLIVLQKGQVTIQKIASRVCYYNLTWVNSFAYLYHSDKAEFMSRIHEQNSFKSLCKKRITLLLWPSYTHFDKLMMFYLLTTATHSYVNSIHLSKLEKIKQISKHVSYLDILLKKTFMVTTQNMKNVMIIISPSPLTYVAIYPTCLQGLCLSSYLLCQSMLYIQTIY